MIRLIDNKLDPIINGMTTMKQLLTITFLLFTATLCTNANANNNTGACCYTQDCNTFDCIETTEANCYSMLGSFRPSESCANIDCSDPANQDYGACCYQDATGGSCIYTDELECLNNFMGVWHQGILCGCISCDTNDPWGACCYLKNCEYWVCEEMYQSDCYNMFDGTHWANKMCNEIQCPSSDLGACCVEDIDGGMICYYIKENDCATYGGIWYEGLPCKCEPCMPTTGVCCYIDNCESHCGEMTEQQCNTFFGSTYFPNDTCATVACPPQDETFGACCYNDPDLGMICIETDMYNCDALLGNFYGGIPCECAPKCVNSESCDVIPSPNCVGPPQYPYPDYTIFGNGTMGAQTASPSIDGGSVLMLFDLNGPPLPLPVGVNLDPYIYNHPSWAGTGNDLGSIFGLAIDEDGNIYVSTTKTWNGGDPVGIGGWGAIYKIDTNDASISIWATLPMPNNESGLGSLTYDCEHSQFFATSFEDGLIYRLDMSGTILDSFDHGPAYDSSIGGPVAFGDRPWAVEVHGNRLYYSLWNGNKNGAGSTPNEIWSIGLNATGAPIAGTEHIEITMPLYGNYYWSSPVADIDFSPIGTMVLGERMQTSITALAAHEARVFEYECTEGGWVQSINQFDVGVNGTDAAGGVDATDEYVWGSGDSLEFGPDYIYGFQGMPITGGTILNSVLVDYQGNVSSWTEDKKMLGDLVITSAIDEETGACCYQENCESHCSVMSEAQCITYFGSSFFPNTTCDDVACPPPPDDIGACCYQDATGWFDCIETDPWTCEKLQGIYYPGIPCICINDCVQTTPTGACCFLDVDSGYMICVEMTQTDCSNKPASSYAGDYTNCADAYCCKPIGACCVTDQCVLVDYEQCMAGNGFYFGDGFVCDFIECEYCQEDLNQDGVVNIDDLLLLISAWGACP